MSEHAQVVRVTIFVPQQGKHDALVEAERSVARRASAAAGCFGAQICEVSERPGAVASVSRWASRQALDAFLEEHGQAMQAELDGLVAEAPATTHYTTLPDNG